MRDGDFASGLDGELFPERLLSRWGRPVAMYAPTPRQLEVLEAASHGLTNEDIAAVLGVAPNTVMSHVHHVIGRLGAKNRTHAICIALREGLIN